MEGQSYLHSKDGACFRYAYGELELTTFSITLNFLTKLFFLLVLFAVV